MFADVADRKVRIDPDGATELPPGSAEQIILASIIVLRGAEDSVVPIPLLGRHRRDQACGGSFPVWVSRDQALEYSALHPHEAGSHAADLDRACRILIELVDAFGQPLHAPASWIVLGHLDAPAARSTYEGLSGG